METENIQIQIPTFNIKHELTTKFNNSLFNIFIPIYWGAVYSIEYIKCKYSTYIFRKKYNYSQLKSVHKDINNSIESLNYCAECGVKHTNWLNTNLITLYTELSEMLENKKEQENEFLNDLVTSFKGIEKKTSGVNNQQLNKMTRLLQHELQNR